MSPRRFHVPDDLAGSRLDQVLPTLATGLSRRAARTLIEAGSVYVDGRRCRTASRPIKAGSALSIEEATAAPRIPPPRLDILWEGEGIVALNKPALAPAVPTRGAVQGTLLHALARSRNCPLNQLHPVHRLDTPTSGVVLVATAIQAATFLGRALQEGRVRKTYLAWVSGVPEPTEGEWAMPLTEARDGVVRVDAQGRPARTLYRLIASGGGQSLLELTPLTGRTHQLRVHCAAAGLSIVGDRKYGGFAGSLAPRALLHAWRIAFPLPAGGEQVVEAPVPDDMRRGQPAQSP